jgi:hypothetical protein
MVTPSDASVPILELAEQTIWTPVEDEVIVLSMGRQSSYFGLRGGAVRIWELVQQPGCTREGIVQALLREFDIDEATARAEVNATIAGLLERGLIRER